MRSGFAVLQTSGGGIRNQQCPSFSSHEREPHKVKERRKILDNVLGSDIAEESDLLAHLLGNFLFAAAYDDIGLNADGKQLLGGVLCGL